MANVIIKTDEQKERENKILKDFGYSTNIPKGEIREYAETAARRIEEAYEKMEAMKRWI